MPIMYSDVEAFTKEKLTARGYDPLPVIDPGPITTTRLQKKAPQGLIFLTLGQGAGLTTELLFDRPFIQATILGKQNDYDFAEKLALDLDTDFLKVDSNTTVGTAKVLYINRAAGRPVLIEKDAADRYRFQCTYITEAQTGL